MMRFTVAGTVPQRPVLVHAPARAPGQPSRLADFIEDLGRGLVIPSDLGRLTLDPKNLAGATAIDLKQALSALCNQCCGEWRDRAFVELLKCVGNKRRGECLRLLAGSTDAVTHQDIVASIGDDTLRAEAKLLVKAARKHTHRQGLTLCSDVDDTVRPWRDTSVAAPVYTGAKELYAALAPTGDVHFITARDGIFVGAESELNATGITYSSIAYGNTSTGALALLGCTGPMAARKEANLRALFAKNPTRRFVLLGDTGQADATVFQRLLKSHSGRIAAVLLHEIPGFPNPEPRIEEDDRVVVFKTYDEAARALAATGLIDRSQCRAVEIACQQ